MDNMTLLHVRNTYDNKTHIVFIDKGKTINDLKFILAKRLLINQDIFSIYKDNLLQIHIDGNNKIHNNKRMYTYIETVHNHEQEIPWYGRICCWRT